MSEREISVSRAYIFRYKSKDRDYALKAVKECVCDLQAILAEYIVIAAKKHKLMKESCGDTDIDKQKEALLELEKFLNVMCHRAYDKTSKRILEYYDGRSIYAPRVTLKAPYKEEYIVDLFRNGTPPYNEFKASENSAFKYIKDTGQYYLCNDIPEAIIARSYENKRIDIQKVQQFYKPPGFFVKKYRQFSGQPERDVDWESYWDVELDKRNKQPEAEAYYKSTLVIPMTLKNEDLSIEFREDYFDQQRDFDSTKNEKMMFGFICIDHRHTDYFNRDNDIRVGYVMADILSLFLVARKMYTQKSKTFKQIKGISK